MNEFYGNLAGEGMANTVGPAGDAWNMPADNGDLERDPLPTRGRHRTHAHLRRWMVAGGLVAALGIGGVGGGALALAHASSGNGSNSPSGNVAATTLAQGKGGKGHADHGRSRFPASLTITTISGQTITATRADGTKVTIHTTTSTSYSRAGQTVSASALASGQHIRVRGERNSDGTITATRIGIVLPGYIGVVTVIKSDTITVKGRDGTHTIDVGSSTRYVQGRGHAATSTSLSAIKVGDWLAAEGTINSDGSLNAQVVYIGRERHAGASNGTPPAAGTAATHGL
jgi:Domain of unknown function (DUF5666)